MFEALASSIIGLLIAALSAVGGHATITVDSDMSSSTPESVTEVSVDESFLVGLANALVRLEMRFEDKHTDEKEGRTADDDSSLGISDSGSQADDDSESDSRRGADSAEDDDSSRSVRGGGEVEKRGREEEGEEEFEDEHEDEFENEDEDEDEDHERKSASSSSGSQGTPGTAGSAGTSGGSSSGSSSASAGASALLMSDVAKHNTAASCYTTIGGNVYDLTAWISKHPGGQSAIKGLCGVDGTAAFNDQHGGSGKPESVLAGYKIGTLTR